MSKKLKRPNSNVAGKCAFCGGGSLSKEHVFADWLKPYVPRIYKNTSHATSFQRIFPVQPQERQTPIPGKLNGPGDPHSRRLRVVCGSCNYGWMSDLQQAAKPILIPLISGKWSDFTKEDQKTLASWAIMYTMVVEHAHPQTNATTFEKREEFKNGQIPEEWFVWIAPFQGKKWIGVFNHFGWTRIPWGSDPITPISLPKKCNTQTTAFVLGNVFFLTFSSTSDNFGFEPLAFTKRFDLSMIWPLRENGISRPSTTLDDYSADAASAALAPPGPKRRAWETF